MKLNWFGPLFLLVFPAAIGADETNCMSDFEDGDVLHYICFCNSPDLVNPSRNERDDFFSLAGFVYGLSGRLFAKTVYITFQSCRDGIHQYFYNFYIFFLSFFKIASKLLLNCF
jgi:hypothetical protein